MSDILGQEIKERDIVIYAKREEKKQTVGIGIVVNPNHQYGRDWRVAIIPLSTAHAKMKVYKVGWNIRAAGSPTVHLNDSQCMVITEPSCLPGGLQDTLIKAMELRERSLKSAEESRAENRKLTPTQRYERNVLGKQADDIITRHLEMTDLLKTT